MPYDSPSVERGGALPLQVRSILPLSPVWRVDQGTVEGVQSAAVHAGQWKTARRLCQPALDARPSQGVDVTAVLVGGSLSTGSREIPEQQRKMSAIRLLAEWKP